MVEKGERFRLLQRLLSGDELTDEEFARLEELEAAAFSDFDEEADEATALRELHIEQSGILDRAREVASERLKQQRTEVERADALYRDLAGRPGSSWLEEPLPAEAHTLSFFARLLAQARDLWFQAPESSQRHIRLALTLREELDPARFGRDSIEDAMARAQAMLGNALRLLEDFAAANEAFQEADDRALAGSGDPLLAAEILGLKATLRRDQGRFGEAGNLLAGAQRMYLRAGDRHLAARVLVKRAVLLEYMMEPEEAIDALQEALEDLDAERDPRLVLMARHNLMTYLCDCDRGEEAATQFAAAGDLRRQYSEHWSRPRLPWLRGKIESAQGNYEVAEGALQEARETYFEENLPYHAALVSFDILELYLRQKRFADIKMLTAEMFDIFRSKDIHREAFAALVLLRQAAEAEKMGVKFIRVVARHFRGMKSRRRSSSPN